MPRSRYSPRHCSILFTVEYVDGVPVIQYAHARVLGRLEDVRICDDSNVQDLSLMDFYDLLESAHE